LAFQPHSVAAFTLKQRTVSPVVELFIEHMREVARSMMKDGRPSAHIVADKKVGFGSKSALGRCRLNVRTTPRKRSCSGQR
jgi:hypothetical protein